MMKAIALAILLTLTAPSPSFPGELHRPRLSDIAGAWEGYTFIGYHRVVIRENGDGSFVTVGLGNSIRVHTIRSITFSSDPFDFSINLKATEKGDKDISFKGVLSPPDVLLLFPSKAERPNPTAEPPAVALLRERKWQELRSRAQGKEMELQQ